MATKSVGLIPCRLNSSRLSNKLVKRIGNYPLFAHTYFKTSLSELNETYICSGDDEIINWCKELNINYIKTKKNHTNGTERCAEAAKTLKLNPKDLIVNIQGDEPLVDKQNINILLNNIEKNLSSDLTTLHKIKTSINNPNETKLVINKKNKVLYISRSDVPFSESWLKWLIHVGIFCFRFETLLEIVKYKKSKLETYENIELLRSLENNIGVYSYQVDNNLIGVDTAEEFNEVKSLLESNEKYINTINTFYKDS